MKATYQDGVLTWGTDHFSTFEVEESASQGGGSSYDSGSIGGGGSSSGAAAADEAKAEKAKKTYTDKTGKKGTKYYYKVRVMVYDAQGKVVAKTSLKQCKYVASVK